MTYYKTTINGAWYSGEPDREMWVFAYFSGFANYILAVYFKDHKWFLPQENINLKQQTISGKILDTKPTHWMPFPSFPDFNGPKDSTAIKKRNIKMKFIGL
jgi:Protein of unknown function (DUF551)